MKYTDKPALLHIEVDVTADVEDLTSSVYLQKKINKLMDFGTQKILDIFSYQTSIGYYQQRRMALSRLEQINRIDRRPKFQHW